MNTVLSARPQRAGRFSPMAKVAAGVLFLGALACAPQPASAQFVQQGAKLVGTGNIGDSGQGSAVALSADGNTLITGAPNDNSGAGAAWVFTRSRGVWTQQTELIANDAVGNAQQGIAVALSADGSTAIVGGVGDNNNAGAAWIFTQSGGVWTQQGSKLVGSGAVNDAHGAFQGSAVALSADGNTAIVGDNDGFGAAWVFARSDGVWTQQSTKLTGSGTAGGPFGIEQGYAVALSADGGTAIVGGPHDDTKVGAVWIFTQSGGVWTQHGTKLVGTGAGGAAEQGWSVALSGDGNTLLVGGPNDSSGAGAAWVFTQSGGVWTQQAKLLGATALGPSDEGYAVALSGDGNTALVGGIGDNSGVGAVWVFAQSGGVWNQIGPDLVGNGNLGAANQGQAVALTDGGNTLIVGGPGDIPASARPGCSCAPTRPTPTTSTTTISATFSGAAPAPRPPRWRCG